MKNKLSCFFQQFWYHYIAGWFEWMDAKCWAKEYHPAWVQYAKKSRHKETRQYYKEKIVAAYRGNSDDEEFL